MAEITSEELLARYKAGERDFRRIIIKFATLKDFDIEGVNFTETTFIHVSFMYTWAVMNIVGCRFINCNFLRSEWQFCDMPNLIGCNLQSNVMRGCVFRRRNFIDCDLRFSQIIGKWFEEFTFIRCDLSGGMWSEGLCLPVEYRGSPSFGISLIDTIDTDGVFYSGIACPWPGLNTEEVPF